MCNPGSKSYEMDGFSKEFFQDLFSPAQGGAPSQAVKDELKELYQKACDNNNLTQPVNDFFLRLTKIKKEQKLTPKDLGFSLEALTELAGAYAEMEEHGVTIGGRLAQARKVALSANQRVKDYLEQKGELAPSGIELWGQIQENMARIKKTLNITEEEWNSFSGQLRHAIDSVETLSKVIDLPEAAIKDVLRVTETYRMRLTPYYASLIQPGKINDPILIQSVPTAEMVDNVGEEIPPVASDHSPARLIDQFYPRVVTIKATNMCAMYCTHCLRLAHIGKKDRIYATEAYEEALDYIRENPAVRDVLITGGDAFMLPNKNLRWLLERLDEIDHLKMKRLGTRIPVTSPQRVDQELLDILEESNDKKPVRVVTQINTAQEITPVSKDAFHRINKKVSAVLNQAVLLKGINDHQFKMWKLCETIQEADVRPYYIFNCSYRNPQFMHLRVPVEKGRDIVESMYGNISGDAIPRYIATAGGKVPLHRSNVVEQTGAKITLRKPWSGEQVSYPDPEPGDYAEDAAFAFRKYYA